jgi:hypothetical protein
MGKNWNTRLTETMTFITSQNAIKAPAIQAYITGLTVPNRKLLSAAMAQGGYTANAMGKTMEKVERSYRRALLLIVCARSNSGVAATDLQRGITAYNANPGQSGKNLLNAELSKLAEGQMMLIARGQGVDLTWGGWDGLRQRPLLAGCAIGQRGTNGPGTLGCFVTLAGEIYILSNMHVLKKQTVADIGILQPAHITGGTYFDEVATYYQGEPLLDAALARVTAGVTCRNTTPEGTVIAGSNRNLAINDPLRKRGVATRARRGTLLGDNLVPIPRGDLGPPVVMTNQILIEQADDDASSFGFQVPGDSGSIVINAGGEVVALMHGQVTGNVAQGQATKIGAILDRWPGLAIMPGGDHVAT